MGICIPAQTAFEVKGYHLSCMGNEYDGSMLSYSYRDLSSAGSLQTFDAMAEFLKEYCDRDADPEQFIIASAAGTEPLRTPAGQGPEEDELWFSGITEEDRKRMRRQILNTDCRRLKDFCPALKKMSEEGCICVVGDERCIESIRKSYNLRLLGYVINTPCRGISDKGYFLNAQSTDTVSALRQVPLQWRQVRGRYL